MAQVRTRGISFGKSKLKSAKVGEMIDWSTTTTGLRSVWSAFSRRTFFPGRPQYSGSKVNYEKARQLYRNDGRGFNLGGGFCRPIIDNTVAFMGLPRATSGDEIIDDYLNSCIETYWAPQLQELFRNATRDSHAIVRFRRSESRGNPLVTQEEAQAGYLEVIAPERCSIYYDIQDRRRIELVVIVHEVDEIAEEERDRHSRQQGMYGMPRTDVHTIVEEITPEKYTYYDQTAGEYLNDWEEPNDWGFVPIWEVFNEADDSVGGGQSDLEAVYPFVRAFHDVLGQALQAHGYHSVPKAKFKVNEIEQFLANNFPDSFESDASGEPILGSFNGEVNWKGVEMLFLGATGDEDVEFLEARSVLGDSKTLLDFLLDCICVASETPKWAFMLDVGAADKGESLPFMKKIERKRIGFQQSVQMLCKMALRAEMLPPTTVPLAWPEITTESLVTKMQALQQLVMALEVAAERQLISDTTARETLRLYLPAMKSPTEEAADAESNKIMAVESVNGVPSGSDQRRIPAETGKVGGANE